MTNVSNLKINKRLNVERPNLRGNENREDKTSKLFLYRRPSIRFSKIASGSEYRIDE